LLKFTNLNKKVLLGDNMYIKSAYTIKQSIDDAVKELQDQFSDMDSRMIIYFASSIFEPEVLSKTMNEAFNDVVVIGCSTAGEIASGKMLKNSIVAMAFDSESMEDVKVEILENINASKEDVLQNVKNTLSKFEQYYGKSMTDMDYKKYFGIVLFDGLSGAEEKVMDILGDLTDIIFIGGSAGDDLKFKSTSVFANGKAYSDAVLLAILKPKLEFDFIKTQSFHQLDKKLVATKVNEESRQVLEFDGKPAADAYSQAIGIAKDKADGMFMRYPIGLIADGEPYVRSPQRFLGDSIIFYCNILNGMELSVLEAKDMIKDTKEAIENKKKELGSIKGLINFHCILRTLDLESKNQTQQYADIFSDIPTIGFSTYGEAFLGHVNQTSTILLFK
jgi:hypothetical protein